MERKQVLITGASSGFGLLTAIHLAKAGFHVIASMRNLQKKEQLLTEARDVNVERNISMIKLDVTSASDREELQTYLETIGGVDILINNAGFAEGGFVEELTTEEYKQQFETNVFGLIAVTQIVLPFMRKQGSGKILNISSISGRVGFPSISPYVASKHAVEGFSESLRLEVKPFGIDVAIIEPGSYQTNIWNVVDSIARESNSQSPYHQYLKIILKQLKQGERSFGNPEDVARLVVSLCRKKSLRKLRYPIGRGVKTGLFLKSWMPWSLWEFVVLYKLGLKK